MDDIFFAQTDSEDEEEHKDQIHPLHTVQSLRKQSNSSFSGKYKKQQLESEQIIDDFTMLRQ